MTNHKQESRCCELAHEIGDVCFCKCHTKPKAEAEKHHHDTKLEVLTCLTCIETAAKESNEAQRKQWEAAEGHAKIIVDDIHNILKD